MSTDSNMPSARGTATHGVAGSLSITYIPIIHISGSPLNPRKHFDEASLEELTDSIAAEGVLQPILVRRHPSLADNYEVVAGERRLRAVHKLHARTYTSVPGVAVTIPAIIRDLTDDEALEIMITENLQRRDIHPMEEAAGFAQLVRVRHMDTKELAARVGKSPSFVAQRLKLMDLIEPIQEHFFKGRLLVKDALTVSQLKPEDQQELYNDILAGTDRLQEIGAWNLRKYRNKLSDAPFDTDDPALLQGKPSCRVCPYNSAAALLFADEDITPICHDSSCFRSKCDHAFQIRLQEAIDDPAIVIITDQYQPDTDTKKLMTKVPGILTDNQYDKFYAPEMPERDNFEGDNDTDAEDEADYQSALKNYHEDKAKFDNKIATGGYIRAFIAGGTDKGEHTWVRLKKGAKEAASTKSGSTSSSNSDSSTQDIKSEIYRITDREKRAAELDDAKVWDQVKVMFRPIDTIKDFTDMTLTQVELTAAAKAIYNKLSYGTKDALRDYLCPKEKGKKQSHPEEYFLSITQLGVNELLRIFFLDTLPPGQIYRKLDGDAAIMMKVAEAYWPAAVETICTAQRDIATKRATRVATRIKSLQAQLKSLSREGQTTAQRGQGVPPVASVPSRKSPSKKGKGIKALISDTE